MSDGEAGLSWCLAAAVLLMVPPLVAEDEQAPAAPDPVVYTRAYPETVVKASRDGIELVTGQVIPFDDGKAKTFEEKLEDGDLADQLSQIYPIGEGSFEPPRKDCDPGRIRCEAFFRAMYGDSAEEVRENLVPVVWMPKTVGRKIWMTRVNGVAEQLERVSAELDELPSEFRRFLSELGGTFNWRTVSGTERLSAHSFGIAIDLNPKEASYWKWDAEYRYRNKVPKEIVEIFERHGFIWGGKWYHYDTMHFEYRPELIEVARERSSRAK